MQGPFLRKYAVSTTVPFVLFEVDGVNFRTDAAFAAGDTKIMKDEGAEASTEAAFVDEGQGYSQPLSATEMTAARVVIYLVDSATKVWLDDSLVIETYGNASAQHAMDFDDAVRGGMTALPNAAADAAGGLAISDAGGLDLDAMNDKVASVQTEIATVDGNVDSILTDTGTTLNDKLASVQADIATVDGNVDSILTDTAAIASAQVDITAILADTADMQPKVDVLNSSVTLTGTASAGDSTVAITLTGGVATDNYYNGQLVVITGGTGIGQARTVLSYLGTGATATPTRDFTVAPDGTSTFVVIGADVAGLLEAGVAQAGGAATITLDSTASGINDTYKNNFIMITGGTGKGQTRLIGAYTGSTKVATILPNWTTNPDSTSIYQVLPMARVDIQGWVGNVVTGDGDWAALKAETANILTDTAAIASAQVDITAVLADTNELQGDWTNTGRLDTILDSIITDTGAIASAQTDITAILADTDVIGAAGAGLTSVGLSASAITALLGTEVDNDGTSISLSGAFKLLLAGLTGIVSGGGTTTITIRDINNAKARITATVTSAGNRTAVTRDAT